MSQLIVISGLPGTGKSTFAVNLAKKLSFPLFSVDPIESAILASGLSRNYKTGLAAYIVAESLASENLKLGLSVIIDAVNPVQEARDIWQKLSEKYTAQLIHIECVLGEEVHKKRIEKRIRNIYGISEVTWEDVEKRREEYEEWKEERLILDTACGNKYNVDKALPYLKV